MNTVYLFYKAFCILKIKVALISCRWSKAWPKAGENNGLIRPPAETVPGLNNREIAPISSPSGVGVETQTPLASPLGSELVGVIGLTPCSVYVTQFCTKSSIWGNWSMVPTDLGKCLNLTSVLKSAWIFNLPWKLSIFLEKCLKMTFYELEK